MMSLTQLLRRWTVPLWRYVAGFIGVGRTVLVLSTMAWAACCTLRLQPAYGCSPVLLGSSMMRRMLEGRCVPLSGMVMRRPRSRLCRGTPNRVRPRPVSCRNPRRPRSGGSRTGRHAKTCTSGGAGRSDPVLRFCLSRPNTSSWFGLVALGALPHGPFDGGSWQLPTRH